LVAYYLADHFGSIVQETDSARVVSLTREYDPYGNLIQGATESGYAYTAREWDPEINLYYYRARYYDPKIGRFLSEDPLGLSGGINSYAYVSNVPTTNTDPSGLVVFVKDHTLTTDAEVLAAYAQMARLSSTLTDDVQQYFWQAYGVDIAQVLTRGTGPAVRLSHRGPAGDTPDSFLWFGLLDPTPPTLNLEEVCSGDPDLFNATLLHELAHYFHWQGGWKEGFVNRAPALDAANRAAKTAILHGPEAFLAEIYQYGRWLTYGGGR
jgi:RHS repeat-associated protein